MFGSITLMFLALHSLTSNVLDKGRYQVRLAVRFKPGPFEFGVNETTPKAPGPRVRMPLGRGSSLRRADGMDPLDRRSQRIAVHVLDLGRQPSAVGTRRERNKGFETNQIEIGHDLACDRIAVGIEDLE